MVFESVPIDVRSSRPAFRRIFRKFDKKIDERTEKLLGRVSFD